jgi:uncharacterized protein YprB with RNaseH-like and TPR domain
MQALRQYNESDLIFLDIETARIVDKLEKGSPLFEAWEYKARHNNEYQEKLNRSGDKSVEVSFDEFFKEKAALYSPFARIVSIVAGRIVEGGKLKVKAYTDVNEELLLQNFILDLGMITAARPDACLCTFNGRGFDEPMLTKRMLVNGLMLPPLLDQNHLKPWEVRGLDLSVLWKGNSFFPDSLVAVAAALGVASSKTGLSGSDVSDAFYAGKLKDIETYCIQDVLCTTNIYRRLSGKSLVTLL